MSEWMNEWLLGEPAVSATFKSRDITKGSKVSIQGPWEDSGITVMERGGKAIARVIQPLSAIQPYMSHQITLKVSPARENPLFLS